MEVSLLGAVKEGPALERLLDGLERSCGAGTAFALVETTLGQAKQSEVKCRYVVGGRSMEFAQYGQPVKVTSRPGMIAVLEGVRHRPVTRLVGGNAQVMSLRQAGYEAQRLTYYKGKQFAWGRATVRVARVFAPVSQAALEEHPVAPGTWLVTVTADATLDTSSADEAAAHLLMIQAALQDRVTLVK